MAFIDPPPHSKPFIDLSGPCGNVYYLIAQISWLGKKAGMNHEEMKSVEEDMKSDDYEHALEVFDKHFGEFIDLAR